MLIDEAKLDVNFGEASNALTTAIEYQMSEMLDLLIKKGAKVCF